MAMTKITTGQINGLQTVYARDYGAVAGEINDTAVALAIAAITSGAGTRLVIPTSLFAAVVVINKDDVILDCEGETMAFSSTYVNSGTGTYGLYQTMFAITGSRCQVRNTRFDQGALAKSSIHVWIETGSVDSIVNSCSFTGVSYIYGGTVNGVAIQCAPGTDRTKIVNCTFTNCAGSVDMKSTGGIIDNCTSYITSAQVTGSAGVTDQAFGLSAATGASITNCKVIRASGAPYSGASIGAQAGSVDFNISGNYVYGLSGGYSIGTVASSYGTVSNNTIDGGGFPGTAAWAFIKIDVDSFEVNVSNNLCKGPPTGGGAVHGNVIVVSTGQNIVLGNNCATDGSSLCDAAIVVQEATTPRTLDIKNNLLAAASFGVNFQITQNISATVFYPITVAGNTYVGALTSPYGGLSKRNAQIYFRDENYSGAGMITFTIPPWTLNFTNERMREFANAIGRRSIFGGLTIPSLGAAGAGTYYIGDQKWNLAPTTGQPLGWMCTASGTFSGATEAGTATSGSPIITAMVDTSDFFAGDIVQANANFASLTSLTVLSVTATTITVDRNANASGATTISNQDPVWKAMSNLA